MFDSDRWMPRWACGQWEPWEGWLYIVSDVLIALAYFAIPAIIAGYVWKRKSELPFLNIFWLFFLFIFLCGTTHLIDAIIFWKPVYQFSAFVRLATAIVSWGTVVTLILILPQALKLRTALQFETELKQRSDVEKELGEKYVELEMAQHIARIASYKYSMRNPVMKVSKEFYAIFGVDPDGEYISSELRKSVHPDDIAAINETIGEAVTNGGDFEVQYRYVRSTGEVVYIHSRGMAYKDETGDTVLQGFMQDITPIKNAEEILQKRAQELESINKELELFAYAASHDLQEPLRKLRAFGDRLGQRYADKLDEQGQDYLRRMDSASARMQSLIDDLLTYSRLSRNKDEKQPVELTQLVKEVASDLSETITEKNIDLQVDELPTIFAISSQMRQLFQNLLSNAFKFTRDNVTPTIKVSHYVAKGRELPWKQDLNDLAKYYVIEVADNGIGFDEQFADKIFAMFQRLHGRNEYSGSGIGLALCKKIVENHDGIIKAQSVEGEGSKFIVVLPIKRLF